MQKRLVALGMPGLIFTLSGFLAKAFYREYIYTHDIHDLGFAGFLPSFLYVAGFSLLLLVRTHAFPVATITAVTLASVLFEWMQFRHSGVPDFPDLFASLAGGVVAYWVYTRVKRHFPE